MRTLGILLATGPGSEDGHTVRRLIDAAQKQGVRVRIFLMADGVYHLLDEQFRALAGDGVEIRCCTKNATERGLEPVETPPYLEWGSQYDLARLTDECDRTISFT